jgi:hypothetical protein
MKLSEYKSEFDQAWKSMTQQFVRIEIYQDYSKQEKSQSLHLHVKDFNKSLDIARHDLAQWIKQCRAAEEKGIQLVRIHYIEQPITPYIFWELDIYKHINIKLAHEQVFGIVDPRPEWITSDFTVFDDTILATTYDELGVMLTAEWVKNPEVLKNIHDLVQTQLTTEVEIYQDYKPVDTKKAKTKTKQINKNKKVYVSTKGPKKGTNW